jgi:hypothetical protein
MIAQPARVTIQASARTALLLIAAVTLLVRLLVALPGGAVAQDDVARFVLEGRTILDGRDIYVDDPAYALTVYPPLYPTLMAGLVALGDATGVSPAYLSKAVVALADAGIAALIVWLLIEAGLSIRRAVWVCLLLWSLNPVSILPTAVQGQIDPIHLLCTLAAAAILIRAQAIDRRIALLAGGLIGLGIAVKVTPIIWTPIFVLFLLERPRGQPTRARLRLIAVFALGGVLPYLISVAPLLGAGNLRAVGKTVGLILGGGSLADVGLLPALTLLGVPIRGVNAETVDLPALGVLGDALALLLSRGRLLLLGKLAFAAAVLGGLVWVYRNPHPVSPHPNPSPKGRGAKEPSLYSPLSLRERGAGGVRAFSLLTLAILLYMVIGGSLAVHYLMWVLPFGIVSRDRWAIPYTLATIPLVTLFYLYRYPQMMFGAGAPEQFVQLREPFMIAAGLHWFVMAAWLVAALYRVYRR